MATQAVKKIYRGVVSYLQYWRGNPTSTYKTIQDIPFYIRNPYDEPVTVTFEKYTNDTSAARNYRSVKVYYKNSPDPSVGWTLLGTTTTKLAEYPTINIPAHSTIYFGGEPLNDGAWGYYSSRYSLYFYNIIKGAPIVGGNIMSLLRRNDFVKNHTIYEYSFYRTLRSTALIDASELLMPSTTLAKGCYREMFGNSTSLVNAPKLPAPILVNECYYGMFDGCSSLNNITCLAEDISANNCTYHWVNEVSAAGTFTKKAGVTWVTNNSGIPKNWTIRNV